MRRGIVLLGHGSRARVDEANILLLEMVEKFKQQTGAEQVAPAWMNTKSGRPGLVQAASGLVEEGCQEVIIVPWFLTDGLHIREDVPTMMVHLEQSFPWVRFALAKPLGADVRLVDILLERIQEVS